MTSTLTPEVMAHLDSLLVDASPPEILAMVRLEHLGELVQHEKERQLLGFSYDHARGRVSIAGTDFARPLLENFRTSSGEDECYCHVRREDGAVYITRTIGHREQIRLLRACLEARPRHQDPERFAEWSAGVELTLSTPVDAIGAESLTIQYLIECVRNFRKTAQVLGTDPSEERRVEQLQAGGLLFEALERVDYARKRLFLWDEPVAAAAGDTEVVSPEVQP